MRVWFVAMICKLCRRQWEAQVEKTGTGDFFLDGTDHCPMCGQPGERDDE